KHRALTLHDALQISEEGKEKVENELHDLKTVKRKEVVERIKTARDFGDLSENSEYDSAKEEQAFVEARIAHLENRIRIAVIIESDDEKKTDDMLEHKV